MRHAVARIAARRVARPAAPLALLAALLAAGCGTTGTGNWPNSGSLIGDATIRISPNYALTVEKIVYSAAGAVALYLLYDPLAPNWEIAEEAAGEDTYRLRLTMKRFHIGGEGEAAAVLRRWSEAVRHEGQYDGFRIERFEQGIESSTPVARRYAHAVVRMTRLPHPELPAVSIRPPAPVARVDAGWAGEAAPDGTAAAAGGHDGGAPGDAAAAPGNESATPLPRPPALHGGAGTGDDAAGETAGEAAGDQRAVLPRPPPLGAGQIILNARVLFDFDSARLSAAGRSALEREVVARRAQLGGMPLVLVNGHTDRIGSHAYNQRLSEARARAVGEFLQARGFAGNRMVSVGHGKTRPLAGVDCEQTLQRDALIECLAPQRRVELEFRERD